MKHAIDFENWATTAGRWHGEVEGAKHGSGVSVIFLSSDEIGAGPRLHRHPYPETFIVRAGRALFTIGDEHIEARGGADPGGAGIYAAQIQQPRSGAA